MQQVEWNIPANVWAGLNTKYDPLTKMVGPDDFITGSVNYDLSPTGNIIKRPMTNDYNVTPLSGPIKDEFEMIFESGTRHKLVMSDGSLYYTIGDGIFTLVQSGYVAAGNMEFAGMNDEVYFGNGIDDPQVYDMGSTYGGVAYTPPTVADMGAHAPTTPVTFAADTAGGAVPAGGHTYKVTFLYRDIEESNGGPASAVHTVSNPNNTVNITAVPVGGLGVTARKIYRDNNDGLWVLVGTIPNNTAVIFTDTAALGTTPIPEDNNTPPLWSLITQFRDRLWVAGVADAQSTLYYSDAGFPNIWPTNNFIACNPRDAITAVTSFNDKIIVFGKSSFGQILGTTSDDFRYSDINPSIGCVDCRSIQIVTSQGIPQLQWLSQFGVYQFDGSNIRLISDKIENLLRFNIQQSQGAFNRNIQTTQSDFQAGTSTPGINLDTIPASITTRGYMEAGEPSTLTNQPTKAWDTAAEWQNGSSTANIVTSDGSDTLKAVLDFLPTLGSMSLNNLTLTGNGAGIAAFPDNTGENKNSSPVQAGNNQSLSYRHAQPITLTRAGTLNTISVRHIGQFDGVQGHVVRLMVWADSAGVPGSVLYTGAYQSTPGLTLTTYTDTVNVSLPAGRFWFGVETKATSPSIRTFLQGRTDVYFTQSLTTRPLRSTNGGAWGTFNSDSGAVAILSLCGGFTFTQTAVPVSGTMSSPIYDSLSTLAGSPTIQFTVTNPTGGVIGVVVTAADDLAFTQGVVTHSNTLSFPTFGPASFGYPVTLTNKRYWKYVSTLSVSDDRNAISTSQGTLSFPNPTWISEAIDHTTDITTLDALLMNVTTPGLTTATVSIATSANNIAYSSFVSVGSATPQRYSKVRVILTKNANQTPTVTSVQLNWTVMSEFISYAITTVVTPVAWGIFQVNDDLNGGVASYYIRSAATEGGLTAESWTPITNGEIIPVNLHPWIQWRVVITSSINTVPEVLAVIVNWLVVTNTGIRVASLWYNQTYFMAAAEINSLANNIVLYYDKEGRWGQYRGLSINTMGLFFNQAYFGDALIGTYKQWLDSTINTSQSIEVDIRSKAYSAELVSNDKTKSIRHLIIECDDSLATITPFYSVDEGLTWLPMVDVVTGFNNFFGTGTARHRKVRFVPSAGTIQWGYSVIVRLYNNDQYPINIVGMRVKANVSDRPVLLRG